MILEPVQNAGGCFVPQDGYFQRVREICDRYDVLLISDEVICAWGRLGHYFGCQRYGYEPDIITVAKALTSAYAPMGGDDRLRPGRRAVHGGRRDVLARLHLRRPPASPRRSRWPTSTSSSARTSAATCCAKEGEFREMLERLYDIPIVGDVRGAGYFHAIELVKDKETKERFSDEESEALLRGFLSGELYRRGLICRADDRGDPVVQLSPPLIADTEQFEEISTSCAPVLEEARGERVRQRRTSADAHRPEPRSTSSTSSWRPETQAPRRRFAGSTSPSCRIPTPWLSGGELLLTTGIPLDNADKQRAFVRRLAEPQPRRASASAPASTTRKMPKALARRGDEARLPALRGPLLDPVHRDHREGLRPARQRAVRGAPARHRGQRAARAAGPARSAAWRRSPRRSPPPSAAPWRSSTRRGERLAGAASAAALRRRARRRSARRPSPTPATAAPFVPAHPGLRGARWHTR